MNTSTSTHDRTSRRRDVRRLAGPIAVGLLGALAVPAVAASAGSQRVDCDAGDDLQEAIDSSRGSARIEVTGTCIGTFDISVRRVEIIGGPGASLDGGGDGPVVSVAAGSRVAISDLTVTGGDTIALSAVGGIDNRGDLALERVTVTSNRALSVGAFAGDFGRAIGGIDTSGTLTLVDSTVSGNVAQAEAELFAVLIGVGGINNNQGDLELSRSAVVDNTVEFRAAPGSDVVTVGTGGVQLDGPTSLAASTVTGNAASSDANAGFVTGGVFGLGESHLSINASQVSHNDSTATRAGTTDVVGGVAVFDNALTINASSVSHNTARSDVSASVVVGGIIAGNSVGVDITDTAIDANIASGAGAPAIGGLRVESSERQVAATMSDSSVSDNRADATGASFAGALLVGAELTATDIDIVGNVATSGGLAVGGLTAVADDGVASTATLDDSQVSSNSATAGLALGGIFADDASAVDLNDGSVSSNTPGNCNFTDPVCEL